MTAMAGGSTKDRAPGAPPRAIEAALRRRLLFGNALCVSGWGLYVGGILFALLFFVVFQFDPTFHRFWGELETANGRVTKTEQTHISNKRGTTHHYFHRYSFEFTGPGGARYSGHSVAEGASLRVGDPVVIEFPRGDPSLSRIRGMSRSVGGAAFAFFLLGPLAGLGLVVGGYFYGRSRLRLLRDGLPARGTLVDKRRLKDDKGRSKGFRMVFSFRDQHGQPRQVTVDTQNAADLEDDPTELLFYDPDRPERATLFDALPGHPRVDDAGGLALATSSSSSGYLWVTLAVLGATGLLVAWWSAAS